MTGAPAHNTTAGLILCGGRSSRMEGQDKAWLRFVDGPLLQRVLGRMQQVAEPVVLSVAEGQRLPALPPGVETVRDPSAYEGPLVGLAEGFRALRGRAQRVVVMPVDMPFLAAEHLAALVAGLDGGHTACLYESEGFRNALTAAYDLRLLDKLERLLAEGQRRPIRLSEGEPTRVLAAAVPEDGMHPLADVDTPEAYREALRTEGVGETDAPAVTVRLEPTLADAPAVLPLYAGTAGAVMDALAMLLPELEPADVRLRREGEGPAAWLGRESALETGDGLVAIHASWRAG